MQDRRKFIKTTLLGCTAAAIGGGLLTACRSIEQLNFASTPLLIQVPKTDLVKLPKVIHGSEFPAPVYLHQKGDQMEAILMLCTHKNCTLTVSGPVLVCPCHGSEFNKKGDVLQGPATEPLTQLLVEESDQFINIHLPK